MKLPTPSMPGPQELAAPDFSLVLRVGVTLLCLVPIFWILVFLIPLGMTTPPVPKVQANKMMMPNPPLRKPRVGIPEMEGECGIGRQALGGQPLHGTHAPIGAKVRRSSFKRISLRTYARACPSLCPPS